MRQAKNDRTPFGKFLAKLRVDHDENMAKMARNLHVSVQLLCAYELGRLNIQKNVVSDVISKYKLDAEQTKQLWLAVDESKNYVDKISRLETVLLIDQFIEKHHREERIPLETLYEIRKHVQEEIR
jgi:hypothetical protein